jgi:flagellar biosynthesis GTPase FlhF
MNRYLSALLWLACLIIPVRGAEQQQQQQTGSATIQSSTPAQLFEQLAQQQTGNQSSQSGPSRQQQQGQLAQQTQQLAKQAKEFASQAEEVAKQVQQLQAQAQAQAQQQQPQSQSNQQMKADITPSGWKLLDQRRDVQKDGNVYVAKYERRNYIPFGTKPKSDRHMAVIIAGPNPQGVQEACQRELQALRNQDPMGFRLLRKVSPNAVIITQGDTDSPTHNDDQILEGRGEVIQSQDQLERWMNQKVQRVMTAPPPAPPESSKRPEPSGQQKP